MSTKWSKISAGFNSGTSSLHNTCKWSTINLQHSNVFFCFRSFLFFYANEQKYHHKQPLQRRYKRIYTQYRIVAVQESWHYRIVTKKLVINTTKIYQPDFKTAPNKNFCWIVQKVGTVLMSKILGPCSVVKHYFQSVLNQFVIVSKLRNFVPLKYFYSVTVKWSL